MENLSLKKFFLYLLICSIAFSALMGIWAIISGQFGVLQGKILVTTITVVGTSILGLACGAYLESNHSRRLPALAVPVLGIISTVICALIVLWMIWGVGDWVSGGIYKTLLICFIFAFSMAQLSLLSLARLAGRFYWSLITAYATILALALIISSLIIFEPAGDSNLIFQMISVLGIVDAAITVMIPIFHRLSRAEFIDNTPPSLEEIDAEIARLQAQIARLEKQKNDVNG